MRPANPLKRSGCVGPNILSVKLQSRFSTTFGGIRDAHTEGGNDLELGGSFTAQNGGASGDVKMRLADLEAAAFRHSLVLDHSDIGCCRRRANRRKDRQRLVSTDGGLKL